MLVPMRAEGVYAEDASTLRIWCSIPTPLHVLLFNCFEARRAGTQIPHCAWRRRRDRLLFAYLLIARRSVTREALFEALWPDLSPPSASASLHVAWSSLKRALEPGLPQGAPSAYVAADEGRYEVRWVAVTTDVQEFEKQLVLAQHAPRLDEALAHLEAAIGLYRGDLLSDDADEPWTILERERLRLSYVGALERLADGRLQTGRAAEAVDVLRTILRLEPWREEAYRRIMGALVLMGRRSEALRYYRQCEELLHRELGVTPGAETISLFEAIAANRLLPPRPPHPVPRTAS